MLFGGAVKDLIMDKPINDLDLILLTQDRDNIKFFFKKNRINYKENKYKGYNFYYNNIKIDISSTNDLYKVGALNTDRLFYDVNNKQFIPIGIDSAIKKSTIVEYYYQGYFKGLKRIKKAKQFINFMNKNNLSIKVKYKYNRLFYLIIGVFKAPHKILKLFVKE